MSKKVYLTANGLNKLHEEKIQLTALRKNTIHDLQRAREMGDLSENGFYKATKSRLSEIDHRLFTINHLLKISVQIENPNSDKVQIGSKVKLVNEEEKKSYTIVGDIEADPLNNQISRHSPLGKILMGKKTGEQVTLQLPRRQVSYTIAEIE